MPNLQGGKKYKSSKHTDTVVVFHECNEDEGQMIGRVLKTLGDRNMLVYCQDNKERVCKVRGKLCYRKSKVMITPGDVVLISLRSEGLDAERGKSMDRGDILAKYDKETHKQLKKDGVNPRLFLALEKMEDGNRTNILVTSEVDFGFEFEEASDGEDTDDTEQSADGEGGAGASDKKEPWKAPAKPVHDKDKGKIKSKNRELDENAEVDDDFIDNL